MNQILEKLIIMKWSMVFFLSIILAGGYVVTFYDSGSNLEKQNTSISANLNSAKGRLEKTKIIVNNVNTYIEKVENASEQFKKTVDYMPTDMNLGEFMQKVKDQVALSGGSVLSFSPSGEFESKEFYETRKFEIQVEGSFSQIVYFLSNLTKMPRLITVDKMSLKNSGGDIDNPKLKFAGVLVAYKYKKEVIDNVDKAANPNANENGVKQ